MDDRTAGVSAQPQIARRIIAKPYAKCVLEASGPGVPNLYGYAYHRWYPEAFQVVREMFSKIQKSICFHRNSHTEKRGNVNLASIHFLKLDFEAMENIISFRTIVSPDWLHSLHKVTRNFSELKIDD